MEIEIEITMYSYRFENLLPGTHFVKVRALSLGQDGMYTEIIMEVDKKSSDTFNLILGIVLAFVAICTIILVATYYKKCRFPQNCDLEYLLRRPSGRSIIQEPLISDEEVQPVRVPSMRVSKNPFATTSESIQMSVLNSSVLSLDQPSTSGDFHIHDSALHSQLKISITDRISRPFHHVSQRGERSPHGSETDESDGGVSVQDASNSFSTKRLL